MKLNIMMQHFIYEKVVKMFSCHRQGYCDGMNSIVVVVGLLFISHQLIRYESSRGHKIDGTKPNQTGNTFGQKKRKGRQKKTDKKIASKGHRRQGGTRRMRNTAKEKHRKREGGQQSNEMKELRKQT